MTAYLEILFTLVAIFSVFTLAFGYTTAIVAILKVLSIIFLSLVIFIAGIYLYDLYLIYTEEDE